MTQSPDGVCLPLPPRLPLPALPRLICPPVNMREGGKINGEVLRKDRISKNALGGRICVEDSASVKELLEQSDRQIRSQRRQDRRYLDFSSQMRCLKSPCQAHWRTPPILWKEGSAYPRHQDPRFRSLYRGSGYFSYLIRLFFAFRTPDTTTQKK